VSRQTLTIEDWLPAPVTNAGHGHWATKYRQAEIAKKMAWASAKQAGWAYVEGKVRLTITLIFGVRRQRDHDNAVARCKHLVDGLKGAFFKDDSTDWMELVVKTEVRPREKGVRLVLEEAG